MRSPITVCRVCSLILLVFTAVTCVDRLDAAEPFYVKKSNPFSRAVVVTAPKVDQYSKPAWDLGANEYTNPCFIAPGAYEVPIDQYAEPNLTIIEELLFWMWFE